jgi:Spy/CpxP family protein refolding chaperone
MGAWWKNSELAKKLELSEVQVSQIEQTFLEHRLLLVDLRADLERQELRLHPLLDADRPDEAKVIAQIDLVTAARAKLDKENAMMLLAIRRVLSVEQWKKLQALHQEREGERSRTGGPPPPPGPGPQMLRRPPTDAPRQ